MSYTVFDILFVAGRIIYGGYFLMMGWNHLRNSGLVAYASSKGVPSAKAAVYVSGIMMLLGGLGIISGIYPEISVTLIAVFLVLVSFKMHAYWSEQDPNVRMMEKQSFLKNMALLGAALMFLSLPHSFGSQFSPAWTLPLF